MLGVASLLLMGVAGLFLARDLVSNASVVASLAVTAAACALTMAIVFSERGAWAAASRASCRVSWQAPGRGVIGSVQRYAGTTGSCSCACCSRPSPCRCCGSLQAYCLGRALGITAGLSVYFAFVPLILLVMLLPVTINGLGTSQARFVWFFARAGVAAPPAFALSVLFVGLGMVGNLPGACLR